MNKNGYLFDKNLEKKKINGEDGHLGSPTATPHF